MYMHHLLIITGQVSGSLQTLIRTWLECWTSCKDLSELMISIFYANLSTFIHESDLMIVTKPGLINVKYTTVVLLKLRKIHHASNTCRWRHLPMSPELPKCGSESPWKQIPLFICHPNKSLCTNCCCYGMQQNWKKYCYWMDHRHFDNILLSTDTLFWYLLFFICHIAINCIYKQKTVVLKVFFVVLFLDQPNTNVNKFGFEWWTQLRCCTEDPEKGSSAATWVRTCLVLTNYSCSCCT